MQWGLPMILSTDPSSEKWLSSNWPEACFSYFLHVVSEYDMTRVRVWFSVEILTRSAGLTPRLRGNKAVAFAFPCLTHN